MDCTLFLIQAMDPKIAEIPKRGTQKHALKPVNRKNQKKRPRKHALKPGNGRKPKKVSSKS